MIQESLLRPSRALGTLCEELADVLIYCLALANALEIDLSEAILEKMTANEHKYPADAVHGRLGPTPVEDTRCPST